MNVASFIEHTNLDPTARIGDIDRLVEEGLAAGFCGVCVPPFWVKRARREIGARKLVLATVAGFPFGNQMTETKLDEIARALDNGADEVDMVWNIGAFKTGLPWTKIEIAKCSDFVHKRQKLLKVIIETAYLSDDEITRACRICADAGADFVKTSTGFAPHGATEAHVRLMKRSLPAGVGIKASGGIKTLDAARKLIAAGADRIGTSAGLVIMQSTQLNPEQ